MNLRKIAQEAFLITEKRLREGSNKLSDYQVAEDIVSDLRKHIENGLKDNGIPAYGNKLAQLLSKSDLSNLLADYIRQEKHNAFSRLH